MNAIVSVTRDWGIGKDNHLVINNKEDMKFFKSMTTNETVIMGRATYDSLPIKPLPNRRNIVITKSNKNIDPNTETVASIDELLALISDENPDKLWVIGGASIYEQLLPFCTYAYVTFNQNEDPCDRFFPDLETDPTWVRDRIMMMGKNEDGFHYVTYLFRNTEIKKFPAPQDWKNNQKWKPEKIFRKSLDTPKKSVIYSTSVRAPKVPKQKQEDHG